MNTHRYLPWFFGLGVFLGIAGCQKSSQPIVRTVLPNGLTVLVKTVPGTPVAAIHLMVGRRLALEKKPGESVLTQMLLTKGAGDLDRAAIAQTLESLGARVKTVDNPYIPFDDYYNSRDYAYVRLEVLDENLFPALDLFHTMVTSPTFPQDEIRRAKQRLTLQLKENERVPRWVARNKFYALLYPGTPLARPLEGTLEGVHSIERSDLVAYHQRAYVPRNCILAVVSSAPAQEVLSKIRELFGPWQGAGEAPGAPPPPQPTEKRESIVFLDNDRADIYMGTTIPPIQHEDIPALRVAAMVLSYRMSNVLREQRGLAYRLGAFTEFFNDYGGLFGITMGTSSDQFQEARDGILEVLRSLIEEPPTPQELRRVVNAQWGSFLRYHQRKINQAYYLSLYEYLGVGYAYDLQQIEALRKVTPDDVVRVVQKYLTPDRLVLSAAGRIQKNKE